MAFDFSKSVPVAKQIEILDDIIDVSYSYIFKLALMKGLVPEELSFDWYPEEGIPPGDQATKALVDELVKLKTLIERRTALG